MPNTVAAPIDTYARPNPESNQAAAFLAGLGKLVGPATDALRTFDTEQGDAAEAEARMKALGAKPDDLRKEIEDGNYFGMAHKRAQTALKVMDAQNRVFEVSAQLDGMNQRGELAGADRDGLIHGLIQQHTDALGGDPMAAKTFERGMLPVMRQYGAAILKQNIAQDQEDRSARLYTYLVNLHDQVDREAKRPGGLAGNNPGNIEDGAFAKGRGGYAGARTGGRFAAFNSPADGYRAANDLLDTYAKQGLKTPAAIIAKWAPAGDGDNDPAAYAASVAKASGLDPNAPLSSDPVARAKMLVAMTKVEHGRTPYTVETVTGWLKGVNEGTEPGAALIGADLEAAHKRAMFNTADFDKKNALFVSPQQFETILGKVAQHFASTGNVAALAAIGSYDRNGASLASKFGPQWDVWTKQAQATADGEAKKAVAGTVDGLEARALKGNEKPEDFYKAVDEARTKDPANFGETRAQHLKDTFNARLAARQRQATEQLSAQQEQAAEREFVEQGARALTAGHGYMLPSEGRFTAADGKERLYTRKDYSERMYQRAEAVVEEQGKIAGWNPEQVAAAKVHLYGRNGDVAPVYKRSFDDLFASSRAGIQTDPQHLQQRLGQLEFMRTTDPGQYLNMADTRDTKQQTWLAAYRAGRDFGMDPERAYLMANQRVFNPTSSERLTPGAFNEKIDEVLKKFAGEGILNGPLARAKAADAINIQLAAGVPEKDIATRATDTLKASHIIASGVAVHNSIPLSDAATAKEYLEDAARFTKAGTPKLKAAPYSIALTDDPVKPGHYTVIRTDTMERLSLNSVSGEALKDYVLKQRRREKLANETIYERQDREKRERGEDTTSPMLRWFKEHQGLQSWDKTWKDGTGTQYYSTKPEGQ
jgi:hypothetical protein